MTNFFPTYLAMGQTFCNRTAELKHLKRNLESGVPTLLISPRRYGKTSLALKVLYQENYLFTHVDLYKAFSEEDVIRYILNGVGQLLGKIEAAPKKLLLLAGELFSKIHIRVAYHQAKLSLEFGKEKTLSIELLLQALEKLDALGVKRKQRLIFFLDEFQMVGEVTPNHALEAALREIVQKAKSLVFIFCGSNRHLMEQIFSDKKRPFYKLCDQIQLERIRAEAYIPYVQQAAQETWKSPLPADVLETVFRLTERHPYYVNKLCSILSRYDTLPTAQTVEDTWLQYTQENKSMTERELSLLPLSQRRLLMLLAQQKEVSGPFHRDFISDSRMSLGAIQAALKNLLRLDYLLKKPDNSYLIIDPLIKSTLCLDL